ncbi:MAG: sulfatase [Planctomycetota bacterium]
MYRSPAAFLFLCFCLVSTALGEQPNLLLITADDLGIQLGCYGDSQAITPHMDRFAESSVRFDVAYVAQASCSPSRSAMLTGLYPHANGQYGLANALKTLPANKKFRLHDDIQKQTLPNLLKAAGYRCGVIGKLHVNPEKSFDLDLHDRNGFGSRQVEQQVSSARRFIEDSANDPFFLMANFFDPHVEAVRKGKQKTGRTIFPDQVSDLPARPRMPEQLVPFPFQKIDDPKMMERVAGYYNCVERFDAAVGMLLKVLKETGHNDDTLIILLGDHGPPVGRGKTTCYEAGLRVPFLVRWPGVSTPRVSNRLVSAVDITPTMLDAAQMIVPEGLHGRSLRPILESEDSSWRDHLFAEFQFHGERPYYPRRCVRDDRYKLIHNVLAESSKPAKSVDACPAPELAKKLDSDSLVRAGFERLQSPPEWELFDLQSDPWEWNNLADDPAMASVLAELKGRLENWREETSDPFRDDRFVEGLFSRIYPN